MTEVNIDGIPDWMRNVDRWILWRISDGKKVPISVTSGKPINITKDGVGWCFEEAVAGLSLFGQTGLGLILNGDGLVAVDLDDCLDAAGFKAPGVDHLLSRLDGAYIEISPSGNGIHAFGFSSCNSHKGINATLGDLHVEMYCDKRYMTVTGNRVGGYNPSDCSDQIPGYESLLAELLSQKSLQNRQRYNAHLTQDTQVFQVPQEIEETNEIQASGTGLFCEIAQLPYKCLVHAHGQRNRACFELARWAKAYAPNTSLSDLRAFVSRWHQHNLPNMQTKEFDETWVEFLYNLQRVNFPFGQSISDVLSDLPTLPVELQDHELGAKATFLLQLCFGLARRSDDGVFFLSGHVAANHLECSAQWTYKLLSVFVDRGYLELLSKGVRTRASEYRMSFVEQTTPAIC